MDELPNIILPEMQEIKELNITELVHLKNALDKYSEMLARRIRSIIQT